MIGYTEYKESGIEWIKKIPSHWSRLRLKHTALCKGASFIDGDWIESKNISESGIKYLTSGNVGVIDYKEQGSGYITEDTFRELNCIEVFPGDILISRLNEPISRACIVPPLEERIITCVDNVIYRPDKSLFNYKFVVYVLNNFYYSEYTNLIARGATMHRISRTILGGISIPVPPLSEQKAIADWLDAKCGKINSIIDKQKQCIALLEELRQTTITQAVTRGLNPDTPLRPSGIDWIGEIPEHWDLARVKNVSYCLDERRIPVDASLRKSGPYPYWGAGNIVDYIDEYIFNEEIVLVGEDGAPFFDFTRPVSFFINEKVWVNNHIHVLKPKVNISGKYLSYFLNIVDYYKFVGGSLFPKLTQFFLSTIPISMPPLTEQEEIATYLDSECAKIDKQISRINREIELLEEYKQSVITEVVTGKRRVCEVASNTIPYKVEPHFTTTIAADPLIDYSNQ